MFWFLFFLVSTILGLLGHNLPCVQSSPHRILVDTDVDTDDIIALLYLLKLNKSEFELVGITLSANGWTNAGHGVNQVYDLLHMMGRDDIAVGVGGEGGILDDGTILPDVGGYLPIIEQGMTTAGGCRYRQTIPKGRKGLLDMDSNYGFRKHFLPQTQTDSVETCSQISQVILTLNSTSSQTLSLLTRYFIQSYCMWDSFMAGVAVSIMRNSGNNNINMGENDFAEMEYFNLTLGGVHSGHVQSGLRDPFCMQRRDKGNCKDGYTQETSGPNSVRVLVATRAKPNKKNYKSELDKEFYVDILEVLNRPEETGRFNLSTQFPYYREDLFTPDLSNTQLGKPVLFDMDMSAGDFLTLFYLLKVPVEIIDLKVPTGWANAATVDVVYDLLHMMGRDDIPVGLGDMLALNQSDPESPSVGDCLYTKAIPQGCGGFLDSDTLYGLARDLPRSARRYIAENSVARGASRTTDSHELGQPLALEVWQHLTKSVNEVTKITVLTNGPLTSLAKIISSDKNSTSLIKEVYIVGGHVNIDKSDKGNIFTVPSNAYAEFNMFLDPLAAKTVLESGLNITLIPLATQRNLSSFQMMLNSLSSTDKTPESQFAHREVLGALYLGGDQAVLKPKLRDEQVKVIAEGSESKDGQIVIHKLHGRRVQILESIDSRGCYESFASKLNDKIQSAVIGSFEEQWNKWFASPSRTLRRKKWIT
ncbi:hypothetical protein Bca4012_026262 [Brassica carinata]